MIQIAICDDEKAILDEVSGYIKDYAKSKNDLALEVFRFDSARTLISTLEDGKSFDIFVLDVYIGNEMGTELANCIRKKGSRAPLFLQRPRLSTLRRAMKRARSVILSSQSIPESFTRHWMRLSFK